MSINSTSLEPNAYAIFDKLMIIPIKALSETWLRPSQSQGSVC